MPNQVLVSQSFLLLMSSGILLKLWTPPGHSEPMRTRSGVSGAASPQKRRRTRSSNGAEGNAPKRQNLGTGSDDIAQVTVEEEDGRAVNAEPEANPQPTIEDQQPEAGPGSAIDPPSDSVPKRTTDHAPHDAPKAAADPQAPFVLNQVRRQYDEANQDHGGSFEDPDVRPEAQGSLSKMPDGLPKFQNAPLEGLNPNVEWSSNEMIPTGPGANGYTYHDAGGLPMFQPYTLENWADPSLHLRIQSLPILENLSVQILGTLAKGSHQETLTIVTEPESAPGQAYATLKSLFDQTKKLYSNHEPFLSAHDLHLRDIEHRNIIRKANLATFVSSIFGSQDVGFYHLNEYFLDTFVPDGARLLKSQGGLYLDLKTQAYLSAMANGERSRRDILEDLFPVELEQLLLSRRPGAKQLTPSEFDFVKRAGSRRDHLLSEPEDEETLAALPDKYVWEDFLRDVSTYVNRNFDELVTTPAAKLSRSRYANHSGVDHPPQYYEHQDISDDQHPLQPSEDAQLREALQVHLEAEEHQSAQHEIVEKAARAAQLALQNETEGIVAEEPDLDQSQLSTQQHESGQHQPESQASGIWQSLGGASEIPYHTQTAPTQVLYERARLAATAKASPNNRRVGVPNQRRPWTTEEENALMAGLDRVKGPHWSQILAMFGAGGTINESLKDRNQVQLKDKARNLKLFFLKSGIEVPYYLQFVTGELKTRAPSQAAKNEAREKARLRGDEDRAHVEGILALAGSARQTSGDPGITEDQEELVQEHEKSLEQRLAEHLGSAQHDDPDVRDIADESTVNAEGSHQEGASQEIAA
ncbi:MAG: TTAGGG repeat binding factor [Sclerophora amabilis]|nr:MAG: TTAGGG repeat binding factor [Sclerophora amabilis]